MLLSKAHEGEHSVLLCSDVEHDVSATIDNGLYHVRVVLRTSPAGHGFT